jgi:hypothetical protein
LAKSEVSGASTQIKPTIEITQIIKNEINHLFLIFIRIPFLIWGKIKLIIKKFTLTPMKINAYVDKM